MVKKDINQPEFVPQGVQPISRVSHCHARAARGWTMLNKHGQEPGTPQLLMMVYPPKVADERSMDLMCIIYIYIYTRCPKTLQTIHFGVPPFQETSIHILYQNRKRKKNSCGIPHLFRQPNDFFFRPRRGGSLQAPMGEVLLAPAMILRQCVPRLRWCCLPLCWTDHDI